MAEWLRSGLQNRLPRFNSGRGLHKTDGLLAEILASGRLFSDGGLSRLGDLPAQKRGVIRLLRLDQLFPLKAEQRRLSGCKRFGRTPVKLEPAVMVPDGGDQQFPLQGSHRTAFD